MIIDKKLGYDETSLLEELDDQTASQYTGGLGGNWNLLSNNGQAMLPGTMIDISFKDGQIFGFGGCNRYFGSYQATGNLKGKLEIGEAIGSTKMWCGEMKMKQESNYFLALGKAICYRVNNDILTIVYGTEQKSLVYQSAN